MVHFMRSVFFHFLDMKMERGTRDSIATYMVDDWLTQAFNRVDVDLT